MKHSICLLVVVSLLLPLAADAGSIVNGIWTPNSCGGKPEAPTVAASDIEAYNKSVAAINDWQQKSRVYFECLINEANGDNAIIADSANKEQAKYREAVERIGAVAQAAAKKLDQK